MAKLDSSSLMHLAKWCKPLAITRNTDETTHTSVFTLCCACHSCKLLQLADSFRMSKEALKRKTAHKIKVSLNLTVISFLSRLLHTHMLFLHFIYKFSRTLIFQRIICYIMKPITSCFNNYEKLSWCRLLDPLSLVPLWKLSKTRRKVRRRLPL